MPQHVVMTDGWPGYWGRGDTEADALAAMKRAGGNPGKTGTLRVLVSDHYEDFRIDPMGGWTAVYKGDPDTPHNERPKAILRIERVSGNGRRREVLEDNTAS